ncbi:hypothetical protein CALCODRAFT_521311 [Calocera cornea HHB12733]|uniref:50S ribosomal protein L35 n=1 Tax=Calocera cornea HHB12733 TaxID=1353952 RepID=A0A165CW36_9BASI|nr:hypothetical protein CALCODRAFT_521311 [Calocera cornea HHB12733]
MSWFATLRSSVSLLTRTSRTFSMSAVVEKGYKLKTHQGTKKRWTALPNGQFKHWRPGKSHGNSSYARARLHELGQVRYSNAGQRRHLKKLLPYA